MPRPIFDLAVVGGGILGLAHAWAAARMGKRVALIERDARANGASIRNFGFITVTGQERGDSWRLARRTRDVWAEVAPAAGIADRAAGPVSDGAFARSAGRDRGVPQDRDGRGLPPADAGCEFRKEAAWPGRPGPSRRAVQPPRAAGGIARPPFRRWRRGWRRSRASLSFNGDRRLRRHAATASHLARRDRGRRRRGLPRR